jgi:hypothetical protein
MANWLLDWGPVLGLFLLAAFLPFFVLALHYVY